MKILINIMGCMAICVGHACLAFLIIIAALQALTTPAIGQFWGAFTLIRVVMGMSIAVLSIEAFYMSYMFVHRRQNA